VASSPLPTTLPPEPPIRALPQPQHCPDAVVTGQDVVEGDIFPLDILADPAEKGLVVPVVVALKPGRGLVSDNRPGWFDRMAVSCAASYQLQRTMRLAVAPGRSPPGGLARAGCS
jgi:hypothetical protein